LRLFSYIRGGFMDKPFKTFDEQVAILNGLNEPNKRKRMNTDSNTKFYLMRDNYYSIINFYKESFVIGKDGNNEDIYFPNVHFNELKKAFQKPISCNIDI